MNQSNLRSGQLSSIRTKLLIKDFLFLFLTYGVLLILIFLDTMYYVKYLNGDDNLAFYYDKSYLNITVFILLFLLIIPYSILTKKKLKKENHEFRQKYLNYVFAECELNDIKYKFRKKNYDFSLNDELESQLGIKKITYLYSLSDISVERVLDYMQITYKKDSELKYGVILQLKTDTYLDGFLQIRTRGEPLKLDYENKKIQRFGFSSFKNKRRFEIYSSLGSRTYDLDKPDIANLLLKISNYLRSNYCITYKNSFISLFIEDFQFNLTLNYLAFTQDDFEKKIDSLIHLHELTNELMTTLMSFKV